MVTVVLHPYHDEGLKEVLTARVPIEWVFPEDEDGVLAALSNGAPILLTAAWRTEYAVPTLRWVQGIGAGYEQFPVDELEAAGVIFANATGTHPNVAEHAFGLLLAMTRGIAHGIREGMTRTWSHPGVLFDLAGSTMAIVGFGTIGEQIARRTQGWGIDVIGVKRDPTIHGGVVEEVVGLDRLDEACERADVLVVTVPHSDRPVIGARQLDRLGSGGWLVNIGRGSVVDEQAMVERLADGRLAGAALDVFTREPLPPDSPLWDMPNVVISPHTAGESPGHNLHFAELFADNLAAWQGTGSWRNRIC